MPLIQYDRNGMKPARVAFHHAITIMPPERLDGVDKRGAPIIVQMGKENEIGQWMHEFPLQFREYHIREMCKQMNILFAQRALEHGLLLL